MSDWVMIRPVFSLLRALKFQIISSYLQKLSFDTPSFIIYFFYFCTFYIFIKTKSNSRNIWAEFELFMNRLPYAANSVSVSSYFFCFVILSSASRRFSSFLRFNLLRMWERVLVMLDTDLPVIALIAEIFLLSSISSHTESSEEVNLLESRYK